VIDDAEQSAVAEVDCGFEEFRYLLIHPILGVLGNGPNRIAILFGSKRFEAVFVNLFHAANGAVTCASPPCPLYVGLRADG
jgi:hypothetical protein